MQFLSIIRHRRPTQDKIDSALSSCYVSEEKAIALASEKTTALCTHNEDVVRLNKAILRRLFPEESIVQVPLRTDAPQESFLSEWLKTHTDFHTLSEVAVGALVMVTNNINLSIGASNGAKATVEKITRDENELVSKIDVRFLSSGKLLGVRSKAKCATFYHNAKSYCKHAFPLQLACAMTGHKSQGGTIDDLAIIHIRKGFCPGLLYAMFSRVTKRKFIKLISKVSPEDFRPVIIPGICLQVE
jgi:hypothetical protein